MTGADLSRLPRTRRELYDAEGVKPPSDLDSSSFIIPTMLACDSQPNAGSNGTRGRPADPIRR